MREMRREGHNQRKQDHEVYLRVKRAEKEIGFVCSDTTLTRWKAGKQHESQAMLSAWRLAE